MNSTEVGFSKLEYLNPANKVIERVTQMHQASEYIQNPVSWATAIIIRELQYCLDNPQEATKKEINQMRQSIKELEDNKFYLLKKSVLNIARDIHKGSQKDPLFLDQAQALRFLASKLV